ncbi:flagellar hook capping FlgD N-terminal domain-containing protein [Clostridium beijerinckii]|uniref:flagellar hook capping FlgD N-terminal domain-containing protein n=1 Tax=Clostridium beijerinckii TaxID=1520 RepID=UPI00156F62B8|nr:flagellar hook capping FlgD N-terminal domain-containing protein [Clostridium beijerinckii]NRT73669.1 flagellar basal-body rod modification protein FlgD [Clostridium beijerinckii]
MSSTNPLNNSTIDVPKSGTSNRGTRIVTSSGGDMDKNAFLKILSAEMANLDPSQNQDSSQYVTQMAQFSSIEQMSNLNSTLVKSSYEQLVGKGVEMTDTDSSGNNYTGIVKSVTTDSSGTILSVAVNENGQEATKIFKADNVKSVIDSSETRDSAIGSTALNTEFLTASQLKGQDVVISTTDSDNKQVEVSGTVKSVFIDNGVVKIRVSDKNGNTKEYPYSSILKAGDLGSSTSSNS